MKREVKDEWVAALRSGEFTQATNKLYNGVGYCCLGVLCKVLGFKFENAYGTCYCVVGDIQNTHLPTSVMEAAGMCSTSGNFDTPLDSGVDNLIDMNDSGHNFDSIANIIEQHWEDL
jgi:hypothetical protein